MGQEAEWQKLSQEATALSNQRSYEQATQRATQALRVAKSTLGPEHPNVAKILSQLAGLYQTQHQYAQAELFYTRWLAIVEKAFGPDHPEVATALTIFTHLYDEQGMYAQAESVTKRSLRIREKTFGPNHPMVAASLNNLATLYKEQGQFEQAEPLYKRALAIQEKAFGPNDQNLAAGLSNLANLYRDQGKFALAEPLYIRSLAIQEKTFGPDHPDVSKVLNGLAELHKLQGKFALADPLYRRALAIAEKALGADHPDVATILTNYAEVYKFQGQYGQAESLYKRSLAIYEKALGWDHPHVGTSLNNLANLYSSLGQTAQAESLYKRALAIDEKVRGPNHPRVATNISNLALLYAKQGQYARAEPLFKRALAIKEKAFGLDHPGAALILDNLAVLYSSQGQYAQAEPLFKRALAIFEKAHGADHPDVALSLQHLAELYGKQGKYALAEPLFKRSLAIREKVLGPDHPDVASTLNNLAMLYGTQAQYAQALPLSRRASLIYRQRVIAGGDAAVREASKNRAGFTLNLLLLAFNPGKEPADTRIDEAFQIVQLAQASGTASAVAKMASRFAGGDDVLAGLVKRKQDASERRSKGESQLVAASSKPPQERKADHEQRLRADIVLAGKEIETIDAELIRRFPEYQELTRPEPVSVNQVRALLKPGEAMLLYSLGEFSLLWVVRAEGSVLLPLRVNVKDVVAKVARIRSEMEFDATGNPPPVSLGVLHELYQSIFAPALPHLAGVKHLMVVPSGRLQELPFGMLVASPAAEIASDEDYRKVDWLARHYAFSVLPSVSSIQAFRQFAKPGTDQEPFAGFGDPLIGKSSATTRGKRAAVDVATVFRNLSVKTNAKTNVQGMEIADVESIREQHRLPETADELRAMGKILKAGPNSIWLREDATETRVKSLDLSKYRTIAFATHGAMASDSSGVGEAGLILTPPQQGTVEDDGYLSASEIAKLKLNADWVVLSACNTAAADGTTGAEGLSGLAKAFFYAGARSLLVSHWFVDSNATVPLTTFMLKEYEANPGQGKAEAHRKAMMALMASTDHPEYAHPIFWAPFVIVGEGGSGMAGR
jgi:CHAT domain-containing protein/tetratricopeptide (TPR) repeat protein